MITRIRAVRRARGLTLADVAARCVPPTTAQTIGRLETGMRTVSIGWLNRIARALAVETTDLVEWPDTPEPPVAAILRAHGVSAPRHPAVAPPPRPNAGAVAVTVETGIGDYRAGDTLWLDRLAPDAFARAIGRDVLVPRMAGRFLFGRLLGHEAAKLHILPLADSNRPQVIPDPAWIAMATHLVRSLA
jgi:transcriptional regulator with XRE-family HTH domain